MSGHRVYVWKTLESSKDLSTYAGVVADLQKQLPIPGSCDQAVLAFAQRLQSLVRLTPNVDAGFLAAFGDLVKEAQLSESAVLTLDLPEGKEDRAWRIITETAGLLGLSVFDDDCAEAFDKRILQVHKENANYDSVSENIDDRLANDLHDLDKWASPFVVNLLMESGFARVNGEHGRKRFFKVFGISNVYINFKFEIRYGGINCYMDIEIEAEEVNRVVSKYGFYGPPKTLRFMCFSGANYSNGIIRLYKDFYRILAYMESVVLPIARASETIASLDAAANGSVVPDFRDEMQSFVYIPQCLIIAWMASSSEIKSLIHKFEMVENWGANQKFRETVWPKLVADVLAGPYVSIDI